MKVPTYLSEASLKANIATQDSKLPGIYPERVPVVTDQGILWPLAIGTSLGVVAQSSQQLTLVASLICEGKAVSATLVEDCMTVMARVRIHTRLKIQETLDNHGDRLTLERQQRHLNLLDKLIRAFEYGLGLWNVHEPTITVDKRSTLLDP